MNILLDRKTSLHDEKLDVLRSTNNEGVAAPK